MNILLRTIFAAAGGLLVASSVASASGPPGHSHGPGHGQGTSAGAAGGPGKASEVTRVVRIETRDRDYNVKQIQVKSGETIRFVITNKSQIRHEFSLGSRHEHEEHRALMVKNPEMVHDDDNAVTVEPGQTKEVIWKFGDRASLADFEFSCNIPGHAEGGMKGTFRAM